MGFARQDGRATQAKALKAPHGRGRMLDPARSEPRPLPPSRVACRDLRAASRAGRLDDQGPAEGSVSTSACAS